MCRAAVVRPIPAEDTRELRQAVLRPHQRAEELVFPGDGRIDTGHFGAFEGERLVGVATICLESRAEAETAEDVWRVRGMAVTPESREHGLGGALLAACLDHARNRGGTLVWCNARIGARAFYERHGFRVEGESFELPGIGVHFVMQRSL